MSISRFRESIVNSGCGKVFVVAVGMAMILTMGYQCSKYGQGGGPVESGQALATKIGDVGGINITLGQFENEYKKQGERYGSNLSMLPPQYLAQLQTLALDTVVEQTSLLALAKKEGLETNDQAITAQFEQMVADARPQIRQSFIKDKKLAPNSGEKEFLEAFKKVNGKAFPDVVAEAKATLQTTMKDPEKRPGLELQIAPELLTGKFRKNLTATDDDVKKSFDELEVKQIVIRSGTKPGESVEDAAKKISSEIKGGLRFDDAMDKYSVEPAPPKKKPHEQSQKYRPSQIKNYPELAPVLALKSGDVSEPVKTGQGYVIYKLAGTVSSLPKDFDQNKDLYKEGYLKQKSQEMVSDKLKEFKAANPPKFASKGFEALYKYAEVTKDQSVATDPKKLEASLRSVADIAKAGLGDGNSPDSRVAKMVYFATISSIYTTSTNKPALTDEYITALTGFVETNESVDLRLTLADLYQSKKDGAKITEQLTAALRGNTSYDTMGDKRFSDIAAKIEIYKKENLLSATALKDIEKEQNHWRDEKKAADEAMRRQAEQEAQDKKMAEEAAKAEKAKAGAQPSPSKPGAAPSTGKFDPTPDPTIKK